MTNSEIDNKWLVCVRCMTYNQSMYIVDALNGFTMQQTDFPFVCTIVDDASTDGEQEVIRNYVSKNFDLADSSVAYEKDTDYGHITFARHRTNENCFFVVLNLKENHFSQRKAKAPYLTEWMNTKYIALCEGDDYWTNPLKLQKQVDFMEGHEEYSMCFHRVGILGSDDSKFDKFSNLAERDYSAKEILENWTIPTASVVYRPYVFEKNPVHGYGDIFLWLQLAEKGKLYCMGFLGGIYRRNENGATYGFRLENNLQLLKLYKFFKKRFPGLKETSNKKIDKQIYYIGNSQYQPGVLKYRLLYVLKHPKLFFSGYMTTTLLSYTPLRKLKFRKKD